jgi:hypothetical protein
MDTQLASVVWTELKRYINNVDRPDAANDLVSILIDNDINAEDIKSAFGNDKDVKNALAQYIEDEEFYDEEEFDDEEWDE